MREHQHVLTSGDPALDNFGSDNRFACAGRRHIDNPPLALGDCVLDLLNDFGLIEAKFHHTASDRRKLNSVPAKASTSMASIRSSPSERASACAVAIVMRSLIAACLRTVPARTRPASRQHCRRYSLSFA